MRVPPHIPDLRQSVSTTFIGREKSIDRPLFDSGFAKTRSVSALAAFLSLLPFATLTSYADEAPKPNDGIEYQLKVLDAPRPVRVHILKIDLAHSSLQLRMVVAADPDGDGPAEAALTDPLALANDPSVAAFINVNPWQGMIDEKGKRDSRWRAGQSVDILGLAKSGGMTRSPAKENDGAAVTVGVDRKVRFGKVPEGLDFREGLNGFSAVVSAGNALVVPDASIHPRSAIGADKDGSVVWLVVADGRQAGFSEGMNLTELGKLMLDLGCWDAVNLDGGGSSVLGLSDASGKLKITNSPSTRMGPIVSIRPVPCILTVRKGD